MCISQLKSRLRQAGDDSSYLSKDMKAQTSFAQVLYHPSGAVFQLWWNSKQNKHDCIFYFVVVFSYKHLVHKRGTDLRWASNSDLKIANKIVEYAKRLDL